MCKLKAAIFDLDDTLIDRRAMFLHFSRLFVRRFFPEASGEAYTHIWETFTRLDDNGYASRPELFHQLYRELGLAASPSDEEQLAFWNTRFADDTILIPGVVETLHTLKERGCLLGMITNGNPLLQNSKIDRTGFRELFDDIIVSGMFGCDKPDPHIFRASLKTLGITAADAVYVGDNPVNDIYGAHRVGMKAVWANYFDRHNRTEYRPDYEIRTFPALLELNLF